MDEYITKLGTLYQIPPSAESLQFCKVPIYPENSTSTTVHSEGSQQLIPVLIQCFAIILLGYLTGRFGLISPSESRGLNTFLSYFSLPSAIFLALATLNIDSINWNLFISLLVSKSIVFLLVAILTSIIRWPNGAGRAGLYAIFCTQSNDFALGFPIISALYDQTHPEFPDYLYLAVPISLAILNPIGLIMMEFSKQSALSQNRDLESILILPLIAKQVTLALVKCDGNGTSSCGYANFAYLYGTVPTAPTVFVYATTFQTSVEIISSGIVAGTLFSAPLMLAASTFINSHSMKTVQQLEDIFESNQTVNLIASATCGTLMILTIIVMIKNKKYKRIPHCYVFIFLIFAILGELIELIPLPVIPFVVCNFITSIGRYLFWGITALAVLSLHLRSFCFALRTRKMLIFLGLILCIIITLLRNEHLISTGIVVDRFAGIGEFSFKNLVETISLAFLAIPIGFSIFVHFMRSYRELKEPKNIHKSGITEVTTSVETSNLSLKKQIMCDHFGVCPREKKRKEFSFSVYENIKKRNSVVTQLLGNLKLSIREASALFESVGSLIPGDITSTWYEQVYFNTIFDYIAEIVACLLFGLDYYATIYPIHKLENEQVYKAEFYGKDLISWICERYAINDRKEAMMYAQTLLDMKIITSRKRSSCFVDSIQLYKFGEDVD
ncbi:Integral membrane protein GPR155 [Nymphon striatum]|nr:Integral membrane protein GPR155 [Nymphon striatum]